MEFLNERQSRIALYSLKQHYVAGYIIPGLALLTACALTFASWLHLCSQACAEGHAYRLYGLTFESIGLALFPVFAILHFLSWRYVPLFFIMGCLLAAVLGAELVFLYIQKYKIGSWCPICVSIAVSLAIATAGYYYVYRKTFKALLENGTKGQIMNYICKGLSTMVFFALGLIIAFVGIGKVNHLEAQENEMKDKIAFGNFKSPVEVYIFTDWECPACRSLEPKWEAMAPAIMQKAKISFMDDPVHDATLNYTPYNISFMIYNKSQYFALRQALTELAVETKTPQDSQVEAIAAKLGMRYRQLNYAEVAAASKYFDHVNEEYKVEGTPTVVIVNTQTKKHKKLEGLAEITRENILKAIKSLSAH